MYECFYRRFSLLFDSPSLSGFVRLDRSFLPTIIGRNRDEEIDFLARNEDRYHFIRELVRRVRWKLDGNIANEGRYIFHDFQNSVKNRIFDIFLAEKNSNSTSERSKNVTKRWYIQVQRIIGK